MYSCGAYTNQPLKKVQLYKLDKILVWEERSLQYAISNEAAVWVVLDLLA